MSPFGTDRAYHHFSQFWLGLLVIISLAWAAPASSDPVMERIQRTGTLCIGFQDDVPPFNSFDQDIGIHQGFSVDMAHQLVFFLSKRFGRKIKLRPVSLKADQRIRMILQEEIDIEMGASTQTYDRETQVDFSLVFFASETTFLVARGSGIASVRDIENMRISVGKGTSNLKLLEQLQMAGGLTPAKLLACDTHDQALWALVRKKTDAYCADRVLLTTKRLETPDPGQWIILEDAIGYEPYAFMVPENNSDFLGFVNNTLRWTLLTGIYFDIYEKWMGPLGKGAFKMSPGFKEYLNVITYPLPDDWWKQ